MSEIDKLVQKVRQNTRYKEISTQLIARVGAEELSKRKTFKEAVKHTRSRLHQAAGAYRENKLDFDGLVSELNALTPDLQGSPYRDYCRRVMQNHASTQERLVILEEFFQTIFQEIPPVESILDLACGLNPLCIPWMPLSANCQYYACDIYEDMITFLQYFINYSGLDGSAWVQDLSHEVPEKEVQLALLLKTLPCLEHLDKQVSERLLTSIQAEYILVSYPMQSLGGRSKGMRQHYEKRFHELVSEKNWTIKCFDFTTELAFLIRR